MSSPDQLSPRMELLSNSPSPNPGESLFLEHSTPFAIAAATAQSDLQAAFARLCNRPLGTLPSEDLCHAARRYHLVRVPFKHIKSGTHYITVHKHFFRELSVTEHAVLLLPSGDRYLCCEAVSSQGVRCGKLIKGNCSGQNRYNHLLKEHPEILQEIQELRAYQGDASMAQPAIPRPTAKRSSNPGGKKIDAQKKKVEADKPDPAAHTLAMHLAISQSPFTSLDSNLHILREILQSYGTKRALPDVDAVKDAMPVVHSSMATKVKTTLQDQVAYGSFTLDTWMSEDRRQYLGVTFHYITSAFKPCSVAIGVDTVPDTTSETLLITVERILQDYNVLHKTIGATSLRGVVNKTSVEMLTMEPAKQKMSWVPCAAHLMQVCVEKALFKSDFAQTILIKCEDLLGVLQSRFMARELLRLAQRVLGLEELEPLSVTEMRSGSMLKVAKCTLGIHAAAWEIAQQLERSRENFQYDDKVASMEAPMEASARATQRMDVYLLRTPLSEKRALLDKLRRYLLTDAELLALTGILEATLEPAEAFIHLVGSDRPAISEVYPSVWDMEVNSLRVPSPEAEELRGNFLNQLHTSFPMNNIPEGALIATYLNPGYATHPLFQHTAEDGGTNESTAKRLIVELFTRLVAIDIDIFNPPDASRVQAMTDPEWHRRRLRHAMDDYDAVVRCQKELCVKYRTDPLEWWRDCGSMYLYLSTMARIQLSIQATSGLSQQLFRSAGSLLRDKTISTSSKLLETMLLIKSKDMFLK
ncbi:hypothetical protein BGZ99_000487 [Dissophora globulifera]|uniref:HAT C-terminal dimerisation domain-containing protein n=1 Tax=Dissophora globulifera TaxID=979702 RepID=A0A9P6RTZ1_9FUNG|nr:hypothetical protein BGZ99_000487 [Dissophora globulifera]